MNVQILKMTTSVRAFQRCLAYPHTRVYAHAYTHVDVYAPSPVTAEQEDRRAERRLLLRRRGVGVSHDAAALGAVHIDRPGTIKDNGSTSAPHRLTSALHRHR